MKYARQSSPYKYAKNPQPLHCPKKPVNSNGKSIRAEMIKTRVPGSILIVFLSGFGILHLLNK
jgi:hypothetical protein